MHDNPKLYPFDSAQDTHEHRGKVRDMLNLPIHNLLRRGAVHDLSRFDPEEKPIYDAVLPELRSATPGTPEHSAIQGRLAPALRHHYSVNSHHPEYYSNGVSGMTLLDMIEMLCDLKAATMRPGSRTLAHALELAIKKHKISQEVAGILRHTAVEFFWTTFEELTDVQKSLVDD
jgi:hypothetical protein